MFQFLSATATGNIIAVLLLLLGLSVKSVFDKIDAAQLETKKELLSQSRLITQILTSLAKMETNIAWIRGDHGVANLKHSQSDKGTMESP